MRTIPFSDSESQVMEACRDAGVVLDFILIDGAGHDTHDEWAHRCAAVAAVQAACLATANEVTANLDKLLAQNRRDQDELRRIANATFEDWSRAAAAQTDPATLKGHPITLRELYGDAFDGEKHYFNEANARLGRNENDQIWSLPDAFAAPPHGLTLRGPKLQQLWSEVVTQLLGSPDQATTMYRWDGDWSPYFDAGREWWGAAAWTIRRSAGEIVVVCASTTD